jgi:SagB-type dehydrogenase family enzyme
VTSNLASGAMLAGVDSWSFALAPDVKLEQGNDGAFLRTATGEMWIEALDFELVTDLVSGGLAGEGRSERELHKRASATDPERDAATRCAALLFRLDRAGMLTRNLCSGGRRLVSCVPLRSPPGPLPPPPEGPVLLSASAFARAEAGAVSLAAPGAWARMILHDRDLLPLLHDMAVRRPASELQAAGISQSAIRALIALMSWCDLLERGEVGWSMHDLMFHAHTRAGYARGLRGKIKGATGLGVRLTAGGAANGARRIRLAAPDRDQLLATDPPHALVAEQRCSIRQQAKMPLTAAQLSEFLFRTLHQRDGRRPYPSGGACYPLQAYVVIHRCIGLLGGIYAYDPACHELSTVSEPGPAVDRLLAEAAGAAAIELPPQILLVLAAQYDRMQRNYPDIAYSLIRKEVGAVFQAAMLAAAAMGLAACPLGCGNSLLFAALTGVDPLIESSVGELMLGSATETV